ncbi:MAG: galactose-1-phosphate uridylyltransferase [Myxococcota bacterium]
MSELRRDPLRRRWVIIAPERGARPALVHPADEDDVRLGTAACPFCGADESVTGPYIARTPGPEGDVGVVANLFPALRIEATLEATARGPHDHLDGVGAHEVVIESPRHDTDLHDMAPEQVAAVLLAWRDRVRDLHRDRRLALVSVFRNRGAGAGASVTHPHSQIIATPVLPPRVESELAHAAEHLRRHGRCLSCDLVAHELEARQRIVRLDEDFVAFCPYASARPFEVVITSRRHAHDFTSLAGPEALALAELLRDVLARLHASLEGAAYNLALIGAPNEAALRYGGSSLAEIAAGWHWRLEILPRVARHGGFEQSTGMFINPTPPEAAAEHLRQVDLD